MGKQRIIAETGAGQHGVATATVCALFGLECVIYMGEEDMRRQELNVFRMRLLGAEVRGVAIGLGDAEGRDQRGDARLGHQRARHVLHPGQRAGRASVPDDGARLPPRDQPEARAQMLEQEGRLPTAIVACVGGGSNAIGAFYEFLGDKDVRLIGVEAGGRGTALGEHAARFQKTGGGVAGRAAGNVLATCCRTMRARSRRRTRSARASTTPASARSTPCCTTRAARSTRRRRMLRRWLRPRRSRAPRGFCRAGECPRSRRGDQDGPEDGEDRRDHGESVGRGDKDMGILRERWI